MNSIGKKSVRKWPKRSKKTVKKKIMVEVTNKLLLKEEFKHCWKIINQIKASQSLSRSLMQHVMKSFA